MDCEAAIAGEHYLDITTQLSLLFPLIDNNMEMWPCLDASAVKAG
jgi:hypothetical protein